MTETPHPVKFWTSTEYQVVLGRDDVPKEMTDALKRNEMLIVRESDEDGSHHTVVSVKVPCFEMELSDGEHIKFESLQFHAQQKLKDGKWHWVPRP